MCTCSLPAAAVDTPAKSTLVVSLSILLKSHATFDWLCALDDDMLRDWAPEFAE